MSPPTVFLMSPASCSGRRANMLLRDGATSRLGAQIASGGAPLAEVFSFLSALYFRGKIAYAREFAAPPQGAPGIRVITSCRGLVDPDELLTADTMREFAAVDIALDSDAYLAALADTARALNASLAKQTRVVLLGSIATGKYVDPLRDVFGRRLVFPTAFVGRGDMSRGGLLLRCARERRELDYVPVDDVPRRGPRPPRLVRRARGDG